MSGPMRKFNYSEYQKSLESMSEPIKSSEFPKVKLDLRGVREYAEQKGVSVAMLSESEKKRFIKE